MKKVILALLAAAFIAPSLSAQVYVRGHTRSDGTYVAPHYRSSPNSTTLDNYSTRGNVNPYTGRVGTRDPDAQPRSNPYGSTYSNPYATPRTTTPCYYNCPD
jgi:hypothetical protein